MSEVRNDSAVAPHVWTITEIKALAQFGPHTNWFYGLVRVEYEGDDDTGVEIAEIYPGAGWCAIDEDDIAASWLRITTDLEIYRPEGQRA